MIKIEKINQFYGQKYFMGFGFRDKKGRCTCLMGRNGVGKTTLSKVIMGLLPKKMDKLFMMGKIFQNFDHKEQE